MDSADPGTLLPSGRAAAPSNVPCNIPAGKTEQDRHHLALGLGGDTACVWSNRGAPASAVRSGDRFILSPGGSDLGGSASEPEDHGRLAVAEAVQADGVLSDDFRKHGGSAAGCQVGCLSDTTRPGSSRSYIHDLASGSAHRQTQCDTERPPGTARSPAREGIVPAAATPHSSGAWKLRRNNSDGAGIPLVWSRERAHDGFPGDPAERAAPNGAYTTVLELQLIHGDGSQQISQPAVMGRRILGYIQAGAAEEAGERGKKETGAAVEEGPQEQSTREFQYWLTSPPHPCSEGLNVLLELRPGVYRHLVQCSGGMLPGLRYWFLKCAPFECLVGDCDEHELALRTQNKGGETVRFLAWLGLDARHNTLHRTPQEFRLPPDPWFDRCGPSGTSLDMSWYPSGEHDEDPDDLPDAFLCHYVAFTGCAQDLQHFIPNFRLIACRDNVGYNDGVIQIDGTEYAYYDASREHVFFLGTDWDEAIDKVWIIEECQEPEGMKFYELYPDFDTRGLEDIMAEVRLERSQRGPLGEAE
jgi:hypothetical protein